MGTRKTLLRPMDYRHVEDRRRSFQSSVFPKKKAEELARAGFVYLGFKDYVQCAYCQLKLRKWEANDDPWAEHRKWKPSCPLLISQNRQAKKSTHLCINQTREEDMYFDCSFRLQTYSTADICVPTNTMAEAGFYLYKKNTDHVKCYSCGIQLFHWKKDENPWEEHAKASPKCEHVKRCKGSKFINRIYLGTDRKKEEQTEEITEAQTDTSLQEERVQAVLEAVTVFDDTPLAQSNYSTGTNSLREEMVIEVESKTTKQSELSGNPEGENNIHLEEENQQLKERLSCKICTQEEVKIIFLPCGHLVACVQCAPTMKTCPVCRKDVTATLSVSIGGT